MFDEWRVFHGFNIEKLITNFFEDEDFVMKLWKCFFFGQVAKKDGTVCPPMR